MTIVFGILVVYALSFVFLAISDKTADRTQSLVGFDQPIAFPIRVSVGTSEPSETSTPTDQAV